jgi:4-oxalocrotonate tautomerase
MPLINIKVLKGALSAEDKKEMISRVSEVVSEIEARPHPKDKLLPYTWCIIDEVDFEHWGIGGRQINPEALKSILEG